MTIPSPWNVSCTASPEPRPMAALAFIVRFRPVCRLELQATTASVSTNVGASVRSTTGSPSVVIATQPSLKAGVEQPAGGHAGALDPLDVPGERRLESQDAAAVDGEAATLEVDDVHLVALVSQKQFALPLAAHEGQAFTGDGLLHELGHAGAFMVEIDVALHGHHRTLLGQQILTQHHLEQPAVLLDHPLTRADLGVARIAQQVGADPGHQRVAGGGGAGCRCGRPDGGSGRVIAGSGRRGGRCRRDRNRGFAQSIATRPSSAVRTGRTGRGTSRREYSSATR